MFEVTVHDPYSEHPHLTDEEFRCETLTKLADRLEGLTDWPRTDCDEVSRAVGKGSVFEEGIHDGRMLTAKRVECACTEDDDPNDHRRDCPMWRIETRSQDEHVGAGARV